MHELIRLELTKDECKLITEALCYHSENVLGATELVDPDLVPLPLNKWIWKRAETMKQLMHRISVLSDPEAWEEFYADEPQP